MNMLALILLFVLLSAPPLSAQGSFFAGKTIRIVVGLPAGDAYDIYARMLATYMGKHIPGNPTLMVQNMPGASSMITANYVYNVAKPDGLTFGSVLPSLYFDQLLGRKEVKFDWRKYTWLGSFESSNNLIYMRTDTPYKTIHDVVTGYQGGQEIDLAVERGEAVCRGFTVTTFFAREPFHSWRKRGFVRVLVQTGRKRDPRLADVPTVNELLDEYKVAEPMRRLAALALASGDFGRPIVATPGIPAERAKILRQAFANTLKDPDLLAEAKKKNLEIDPTSGDDLEALANDVLSANEDAVARLNKLLK
jgi:tripartite-type tricarboxylate transporter receptor subunit TctC